MSPASHSAINQSRQTTAKCRMSEFCKLLGSVPHGHRHWEVPLHCPFHPLAPLPSRHASAPSYSGSTHVGVALPSTCAYNWGTSVLLVLFEMHKFNLNYNIITHYCIALLLENSLWDCLLKLYRTIFRNIFYDCIILVYIIQYICTYIRHMSIIE